MSSSSSSLSALLWGCVAALTWGLTGIFIKLLPGFTTLEVLSIRISVALICTIGTVAIRPNILLSSLRLIKKPIGVLLASLMVFYYLFAVRAFQLAPVGDVALTVGLSPLLGLVAKLAMGKGLAPSETGGAVTAFIGLLLFVFPKIQGTTGIR